LAWGLQYSQLSPQSQQSDQGSCQLEVENIQLQFTPQESSSLANQSIIVPAQHVMELPVQTTTKQQKVVFQKHMQATKADDHEAHALVVEFKKKVQHGEENSSGENSMEKKIAWGY
jgi:hypothetical protein